MAKVQSVQLTLMDVPVDHLNFGWMIKSSLKDVAYIGVCLIKENFPEIVVYGIVDER